MFTTLSSRVAGRVTQRLQAGLNGKTPTFTVSKARMGSSSHDHHHKPYEYNPEIVKKFNLKPISADGVYREPYQKIYDKPFHYQADAYFIDPVDTQLTFDRNGPTNIRRNLKHFMIFNALLLLPLYVLPKYFLGDEKVWKPSAHPQVIQELVSKPTFHTRKIVTSL